MEGFWVNMESEKMKILNPLVTVNILSYNRKEELCFTLSKVFEQNYKNIEVIVVDNVFVLWLGNIK